MKCWRVVSALLLPLSHRPRPLAATGKPMVSATTSKTSLVDSIESPSTSLDRVYLRPRPYARQPGLLLLVPLLPARRAPPTLPEDAWRQILEYLVLNDVESKLPLARNGLKVALSEPARRSEFGKSSWRMTLVCKEFKSIVLPLLYSHCKISTLASLNKFTTHLSSSDQKWDSIRRIPYSTPGRWVRTLDISDVTVDPSSSAWEADTLLNTIFPLLPFLSQLNLSLSVQLSRRSMALLGLGEGAQHLRRLTGVRYYQTSVSSGEDPLEDMVSKLSALEELEVFGHGADVTDIGPHLPTADVRMPIKSMISLNCLTSLKVTGMPSSSLLDRLTSSPLSSLRQITVTPYGENVWPISSINALLTSQGDTLESVNFHTPQSWPVTRLAPPRELFAILPNLRMLSIESNLFDFEPPPPGLYTKGYPLETLSITRPAVSLREQLFPMLIYFPNLREVRARDVRWAKKGMSARAREAGFQGEMCAWRRLLALRKIQMLDADGLTDPEA